MTLKEIMSFMDKTQQTAIQAKAFDFALTDLVRRHRESFQPLWTVDSWVKFMIWMTLNCGLSGERETLELFAESLGSVLTSRMRKLFFERNLETFSLCVMADPAETIVLLLPFNGEVQIPLDKASQALESIELSQYVVLDQAAWSVNDGVISIPWKSSESKC
tara:strand:- start:20786 stop:21271 length:486 start_codon:yes stop_codon:yes gene_type:complete